ncbi:hypothetical protein F0562_030496 [Nyssa sinensis]|uniref:Glycosyltransferase n=1 Tax=Nyssa sinensis TaxID=561372 RepID=A0A5J5AX40_9ASTE|nr:hypothetical protein F0562_030496 [Nyssa sinensis]
MSTINSSPEQRHVAALAFPFASHAGHLLGLVHRLAVAAPDVTFSFFNFAESNRSLFSVATPDNIKAYDVPDGVPEGYVFSGKPQENINLFLKVAPENFKRGIEGGGGGYWEADQLLDGARISVVFRKTIGTRDIAGRQNEILKFIPGFSTLRLGDLPDGVLFGNLESPFSIMLHKMGQALPRATAVPINSFEELDPAITKDLKSKFPYFLNVGPFNLTSPPLSSNLDEHGCIPWLDKQKAASVAYIAFGTVATLPPHELVALAEALETSGTPFLWSLKDNLKHHLPEGFLKRTSANGKIVPWAPQVQVLTHNSIGVFITHCGWSSVLDSAAAGVPLIGRPFFGDQQINTWMVENVWQIGVRVEGGVFTKSGTICALEMILKHENGNKLKKQIQVMKEVALKAVGPNGSSTENFKTLLEVVTSHKL